MLLTAYCLLKVAVAIQTNRFVSRASPRSAVPNSESPQELAPSILKQPLQCSGNSPALPRCDQWSKPLVSSVPLPSELERAVTRGSRWSSSSALPSPSRTSPTFGGKAENKNASVGGGDRHLVDHADDAWSSRRGPGGVVDRLPRRCVSAQGDLTTALLTPSHASSSGRRAQRRRAGSSKVARLPQIPRQARRGAGAQDRGHRNGRPPTDKQIMAYAKKYFHWTDRMV